MSQVTTTPAVRTLEDAAWNDDYHIESLGFIPRSLGLNTCRDLSYGFIPLICLW